MKQLREFVEADVQLLEETGESGLPKFRGIFQKCDEENRNSRIYSRKLWESVLTKNSIQEKLKNRTMLGEINHPDYRDPNPENASHVVTKLWLSEDGTKVYGEAEILPTPKGKVLEALIRSGVKIGVSSRGEGTLVQREGKDYVKEESYHLSTFDAVLEPSVESAVPSLIESKFGAAIQQLVESGNIEDKTLEVLDSLTETFTDQDISQALKTQILEAKSKHSNTKGQNSMENLKEALAKIEELNKELSEKDIELVRQEEKNKNLRNEVASAKTEKTQLKRKLAKVVVEAKKVPKLQEQLDEKSSHFDKAVEVIEGLKNKYSDLKESSSKVQGFYQKSLAVIEGIQNKLRSQKVDKFLEENLKNAGGREKFSKIIGSTDGMTLEEAHEKVNEIKKLVGDETPFSTPLALREEKDKGEEDAPQKLKEGTEKTMGSILDMMS